MKLNLQNIGTILFLSFITSAALATSYESAPKITTVIQFNNDGTGGAGSVHNGSLDIAGDEWKLNTRVKDLEQVLSDLGSLEKDILGRTKREAINQRTDIMIVGNPCRSEDLITNIKVIKSNCNFNLTGTEDSGEFVCKVLFTYGACK